MEEKIEEVIKDKDVKAPRSLYLSVEAYEALTSAKTKAKVEILSGNMRPTVDDVIIYLLSLLDIKSEEKLILGSRDEMRKEKAQEDG